MRSQRIAVRALGLGLLACVVACQSGCSSLPMMWSTPGFAPFWAPAEPLRDPLLIPSSDYEAVWNKTVSVVSQYFPIMSENRLAGTIRTDSPMTGTLIEPWTRDTASLRDRIEATLQTYRRFALVQIEPAPTGGFLVRVEVMKELEDCVKPISQPAGRAVFYNDFPVNRTREIVGPVPAPVGWIPQGRDHHMEQQILSELHRAFLL